MKTSKLKKFISWILFLILVVTILILLPFIVIIGEIQKQIDKRRMTKEEFYKAYYWRSGF